MDMDTIGFFLFMEEQEREENEQKEGDSDAIILHNSQYQQYNEQG